MFRIWFKLWKNGKMIRDLIVERPEEDTRTHKIFNAIDECCREFDIGHPIWLDANIRDFKLHSKVKFTSDNFIENIHFHHMEIEVLEED